MTTVFSSVSGPAPSNSRVPKMTAPPITMTIRNRIEMTPWPKTTHGLRAERDLRFGGGRLSGWIAGRWPRPAERLPKVERTGSSGGLPYSSAMNVEIPPPPQSADDTGDRQAYRGWVQVNALTPYWPFDPAYLDRVRAEAQRISLGEGEKKTQDLRGPS